MQVDVLTEITINRQREVVADFAANPGNAPLWSTNIKQVQWTSAPKVVVGAEIAFVAHFLGKRLAYTYAITAYRPHEHLVMQTAQGPFPMVTTYTWRNVYDTSTIMTLRNVCAT